MSRPQTANEIRQSFLDFFREKEHEIVPSAPLVPHDDPTLLFINAGMNPFKDVFLGTGSRPYDRAADTQKCLRVSGKHNDLDEVGLDTYHHTFFEMLGNWSFGDYFKKEAIAWAWELLVDRWGLDPDRLYVTVHEGDEALGLEADTEAADLWTSETSVRPAHILYQSSKDNFWMMGETGPCGPCSEIHVDLRDDHERATVPGIELVNKDDPRVMEIWNLVFIQYNAAVAGEGDDKTTTLAPLDAQHIDTGMGFERIAAVLQGKSSNYDTDLFAGLLGALSERAGLKPYDDYTEADDDDRTIRIAMRVIVDHVRTLAFAIADGAQPGNTGRGYVIRRILRRAVRYGYQGLGLREPFMGDLIPALVEEMGDAFPEVAEQQETIQRIITGEEEAFLKTLESGIDTLDRSLLSLSSILARQGVGEKLQKLQVQLPPNVSENLKQAFSGIQESLRSLNLPDSLEIGIPDNLASSIRVAVEGLEGVKIPNAPLAVESISEALAALQAGIDPDILRKAYSGLSLGDAVRDMRAKAEASMVPGEIAFLLHDTYGFPSDLTAVMARERGLTVDEARFEELMGEQRDRARAASGFAVDNSEVDLWDATADTPEAVEFVGYDRLGVEGARILKTRTVGEGEDARHELVLDTTPFYAESGGQVGDTGTLTVGDQEIAVLDTVKDAEGTIIHVVETLPDDRSASVTANVDADRRQRIVRHHTATHLLHAALRETLGSHVQQKGSLVAPDRLRFDFSHFERLSDDERRTIEDRVNALVLQNIPKGEDRDVPLDEAKAQGAMALFGEKYGERVRVITFGPESVELCGGTHAASTGEVGLFALVSEGSVASGVRRVEAVAGEAALAWMRGELDELESARARFKQLPDGLGPAIEALQDEQKTLAKELDGLRAQQAASGLDQILIDAAEVDGVRVATGAIPGADMDVLRDLAETARGRMTAGGGAGVAVFGAADAEAGKAYLAASVTDDLVERGVQAGKLVGALARLVGGGGGGRPTLATAGGKNPDGLDDALAAAPEAVRDLLG